MPSTTLPHPSLPAFAQADALARIHEVYGDLVETIAAPWDGHFVRSTTFVAVAAGERVATLGLE